MSVPPPDVENQPPQNIAGTIAEVSERATRLVQEEVELLKAEISESVSNYVRGAIVFAAAGVFVLTALVFALVGCAWLLYYYLPGATFAYFWGFFAMAVILLVLGAVAGLIAARAVKRASPPLPSMAIEEARKIRETVAGGGDGSFASAGQVPAGSPPAGAGGG
jgi:uncharacterized membrane protein YqjE